MGPSHYLDLRLTGEVRLADALNHLYVLLPVLDDAKHYWVSTEEVDKLIRAGGDWLAAHPAKELITRRYLSHQRELTQSALARLAEADDAEPEELDNAVTDDDDTRQPLAVQRREAILATLRELGARRVGDFGCGVGRADQGPARRKADRTRRRGRRVRPGPAARRAQPAPGPDAGRAARAPEDLPVRADLPRRPAGRAGRGRADGGHRARRSRTPARARARRLRLRRARHGRGHHAERRVQRPVRHAGPARCGTATTASSGPAPSSAPGRNTPPHDHGYQVRFLPVGPEHPDAGPPTQLAVFTKAERMTELSIPELSLVVLVGVTGSGKSTFARAHFKPTEVISSDYCRGLVADDENDQSATKDAFEVLHFIVGKRLDAGRLTVVDATNVQPEARRELVRWPASTTCSRWRSSWTCRRSCAPSGTPSAPTATSART